MYRHKQKVSVSALRYFRPHLFLASPQINRNRGVYFAVGTFFIQPLESSCGFCCCAPAHPPTAKPGRQIKLGRFFFPVPPLLETPHPALYFKHSSKLSLLLVSSRPWLSDLRAQTAAAARRSLKGDGARQSVCRLAVGFRAAPEHE